MHHTRGERKPIFPSENTVSIFPLFTLDLFPASREFMAPGSKVKHPSGRTTWEGIEADLAVLKVNKELLKFQAIFATHHYLVLFIYLVFSA